jgi:hypothetical protein
VWQFLIASLCGLVLTHAGKAETYPQSQGWTQSSMRDWYQLSQGSRLIPLPWLQAFQKNDQLFTRRDFEDLGFLYFSQISAWPVGFVPDREEVSGKSWLGLNCAACHTGKLKANGREVFIHGGQNMADLQGLMNRLIAAVESTRKDPQKFSDFSQSVLGENVSQQRDALAAEIDAWLARRKRINDTAIDSHWGRGRADAVGIILATTAVVVSDPKIPPDEQEPLPASNAPVSYPHIWNTNQMGRLQHNGIVDNGVNMGPVKVAKIGALIRNWTEVFGVFADSQLSEDGKDIETSINKDNLLLLEQALAELQSPSWPAAFGKLDDERRQKGAALFQQNCASCHGTLEGSDTETLLPKLEDLPAEEQKTASAFVRLLSVIGQKTQPGDFEKTLTPTPDLIGTDPTMACNAFTHQVPSGRLEGERNAKGFVPLPGHPKFGERAVTTDLLRTLIQRDVFRNKTSNFMTIARNQMAALSKSWRGTVLYEEEYDPVGQNASDDPLFALRQKLEFCATAVSVARAIDPDPEIPWPVYKARPLNGIWATAPYLHNGSVPTLHDLLLPQAQRPKTFGYFNGEMDLMKVGLKDQTAEPTAFQFRVFDDEGRAILGNWNGGHEFGTALSDEERVDLVEYLKGL